MAETRDLETAAQVSAFLRRVVKLLFRFAFGIVITILLAIPVDLHVLRSDRFGQRDDLFVLTESSHV